MEFIFPNNLRNNIHIISVESIYTNRIIKYLKKIETIWYQFKDEEQYKNKVLFFVPYQKPIYINECSNSNLMESFSYLLHHYIQIFTQIQKIISTNSNNSNTYQKYYIISGYSLSSFKEVFAKVTNSNNWLSKYTQLTKFCDNLNYVIQYFKPDKHIYDFNTKDSILEINNHTILNRSDLNLENSTNILTNSNEPNKSLVSILSKLFKYLNEWMDKEKKSKNILCLDGAIFHKISQQEKYLLAILDFLLDN